MAEAANVTGAACTTVASCGATPLGDAGNPVRSMGDDIPSSSSIKKDSLVPLLLLLSLVSSIGLRIGSPLNHIGAPGESIANTYTIAIITSIDRQQHHQ